MRGMGQGNGAVSLRSSLGNLAHSLHVANKREHGTTEGNGAMQVKAYGLVEDGKVVWYRTEDDTKIEPSLFDVEALDTVAIGEVVRPIIVWADTSDEYWEFVGSAWTWDEAICWAKAMSIGAGMWTRVTSLD